MAKKEANFDLYIHDLLVEAGIQADTQGSNIVPINEALKTASKHQTGKAGFPEYTAVVDDFVLVMEDKADRANLCLKEKDGTISMTVQATTDYAVNGALHYAQHILQKTTYKKVFAFGMQIPLHRITDSASNGSVFPVVTEHFSASSDHAFL